MNNIKFIIAFVVLALLIVFSFCSMTFKLNKINTRIEVIEAEEASLRGNFEEPAENEEYTTVVSEIDTETAAIQTEIFNRLLELDEIKDNKEWYVALKNICEEYKDYIPESESVYDHFSDQEIEYMLRMIETETHGSSFNAKVNVANVLFNRLQHPAFADDVIVLITSPNQFAYSQTNITEDTRLALEFAFLFADTTQGATSFRSQYHPENWNGSKLMFIDEAGHGFYTRYEDLKDEVPDSEDSVSDND